MKALIGLMFVVAFVLDWMAGVERGYSSGHTEVSARATPTPVIGSNYFPFVVQYKAPHNGYNYVVVWAADELGARRFIEDSIKGVKITTISYAR